MVKSVLVITPTIKPGGGPPGYVHNLMVGIQNLSKNGFLRFSYDFLGQISDERNKATGENQRTQTVRLSLINLLAKIKLKPLLSRKIREAKSKIRSSDIIIFQGFQETYLPEYAIRLGKRVVYMPHSPSCMADEYKMLCELNGVEFSSKRYNSLIEQESILFRISDFVVFPSEGASTEYSLTFPEFLHIDKVFYIKSGVDVDHISRNKPERDLPRATTRIIFAGRYVSHKGYDLFCDAARLIGEKFDRIEFITLGDGPMRANSQHVNDLGWRDDVFDVLQSADIVVIPNRIAYYDLLPLECAAIGKPLVMTAVGGNVDQMHDLPDTLACEGATSEHLAAAIGSAIRELEADPYWGCRNRDAYESMFTVEKFAERWDAAIEAMLSSK